MKKLLISLFCVSSVLVGCSSASAPKPQQPQPQPQSQLQTQPHQTVVVLTTCEQMRNLVKDNHLAIEDAFADNDASTIGTLELQNRSIIQSNLDCFPKWKEHLEHWHKMNNGE